MSRADIQSVTFALDGKNAAEDVRSPFSATLDFGDLPMRHVVRAIGKSAAGVTVGESELIINDRLDDFALGIDETRSGGKVHLRIDANLPLGSALRHIDVMADGERVARLRRNDATVTLTPSSRPIIVRAIAYLEDGRSVEQSHVVARIPGEVVTVHRVEVYATVTDRHDRPVPGLTCQDFDLREEGEVQVLESCRATGNAPLTAGLAIDSSASMREELQAVREASLSFLERVVSGDGAAFVVDFDSTSRLRHATSRDSKGLAEALQSLRPDGGTAVYDAIVFSLIQFQNVPGKKALVVLSDGRDTLSRYTADQAAAMARRMGVPIYAIIMDHSFRIAMDRGARPDAGGSPTAIPRRLAQETGGKTWFLKSTEGILDVYQEIDREIRGQYLITYSPSEKAGPGWRSIAVRTRRDDLRIRAATGYFNR